jgi:hypothetical protein
LDSNEEMRKKLTELVANLEEFDSKWTRYLSDFNIDDSEIEKAIQMAKLNLDKVRFGEINVYAFLFQNQMPFYVKPNLDSIKSLAILGYLKFNKVSYFNQNFDKLIKLNLKNMICNSNITSYECIWLDSNCFALILFINSQVKILVLDKKGRILKFITTNFTNYYKIKCIKNQIIIWAYSNNIRQVCLLNDDLQIIKSMNINIIDLASNDTNIYCLENNTGTINVYNNELTFIKSFAKKSTAYDFPPSVSQFEADDDFFYFLSIQASNNVTSSSSLMIMNINDGALVKNISLTQDLVQFSIVSDKILASYDNKKKKCVLYDQSDSYERSEIDVDLNNNNQEVCLAKGKIPYFFFCDFNNKEFFIFQ